MYLSRPCSSHSTHSRSSQDYELSTVPEAWQNLSEIEAPAPLQNPNESPGAEHKSLEDALSSHRKSLRRSQQESLTSQDLGGQLWGQLTASNNGSTRSDDIADAEEGYSAPPGIANLTEAIPGAIIDNPEEAFHYSHHNLEEELGQTQPSETRSSQGILPEGRSPSHKQSTPQFHVTSYTTGRITTEIYIFSYFVFFSILGTLARLGLTALTTYPADVIHGSSVWPNFAGTLILGFVSEGAELLHHPASSRSIARPNPQKSKEPMPRNDDTDRSSESLTAANSAEKRKVPIPLHLGLTTGFCGSLTSFSAFMRDCFGALSGMLFGASFRPSWGRDFMNVAAVIIITMSLCIAALKAGAHVAILVLAPGKRLSRRVIHWVDRIVLVLGVGCWSGAIILCIIPPDRFRVQETWRGQALFAVAFAPIGCFLRLYLSVRLNLRIVGFPLGTFCVNMLGTLILAVVWDLQRIPDGNIAASIGTSLVSCQVLQGIEDGFCGCLTTVSTWILELSTLRRWHAYRYGVASLFSALAVVVTVMGSLKWTVGLSQPVCTML